MAFGICCKVKRALLSNLIPLAGRVTFKDVQPINELLAGPAAIVSWGAKVEDGSTLHETPDGCHALPSCQSWIPCPACQGSTIKYLLVSRWRLLFLYQRISVNLQIGCAFEPKEFQNTSWSFRLARSSGNILHPIARSLIAEMCMMHPNDYLGLGFICDLGSCKSFRDLVPRMMCACLIAAG